MPNPDPTPIDWPRVYAEAVAIALSFTTRDAREIVAEAVKLHLEGRAPWVPGGDETLPEHLVSVGLKARSDRKRVERRRWRPEVVSKIALMFQRSAPTPEQDLTAAEEKHRKALRFEKLVSDLEAEDPEAHQIVLLEQEGVGDPIEQAARSGMDIESVRNARKRIKRRVLPLSDEDEDS